jgi:aspartate/tyrosine/aromatic aminotransferase
MFEKVTSAPPDPVFGIMELFRQDSRSNKINLTVGAYQNDAGLTPVLEVVKEAETRLLRDENTKNYLPIDGAPSLAKEIARLVLGTDHPVFRDGRFATAHTPGGTAALRVAGDLARANGGSRAIWAGTPTWANHPQIFHAAQLNFETFPHLTPDHRELDFDSMRAALQRATAGDAVLLHTVCHNPTGFDLNRDQWLEVFDLVAKRNLLPIFDFAYQGFGTDPETDAWPIREFVSRGHEALICSSFSKNMGLYGERVGAITAVVAEPGHRAPVLSQIKSIIRTIYSTPPMHGGAIVDIILHDAELKSRWFVELETMRQRIIDVRAQFVSRLSELAPSEDFSFINRQNGMFSFSGLSRDQVIRLRDTYSIYAVENGRINIAGVNASNLEPLCSAIAEVLNASQESVRC